MTDTSKNTVKPVLTRQRGKRAKRAVENPQFAAFARRILAAYVRRITAGDIEALPSMAQFVSDVDTALRVSVQGLRRFGYSWTDIATRLGVTRQAVQMRYGEPADRGALDRRLLDAGIGVTVATLVAVFADHWPDFTAGTACPACGYQYPSGVTDCPTNATVRPLLYRRRTEDPKAVASLTDDQVVSLHNRKALRHSRTAARQAARSTPLPAQDTVSLFDLLGGAQ